MGGGSNTVITNEGGEFKVLPEFQPFIAEMGNQLTQLLQDPMTNPGRFAHEQPLGFGTPQDAAAAMGRINAYNQAVPGIQAALMAQGLQEGTPQYDQRFQEELTRLGVQVPSGQDYVYGQTGPTDLQANWFSQIGDIADTGIPRPEGSQMAYNWLSALPGQMGPVDQSPLWGNAQQSAQDILGFAGEQGRETDAFNLFGQGSGRTPVSSQFGNALGTAGNIANVGGTINQQEQQGIAGLNMFAGGDIGNSPAVQSTIQGLESNIVPMLENRAAQMGLANSGELVRQIGQSYAQQLAPVYQQGMQQQMQAAGQLGNIGNTLAQRQMAGLQSLRDMQVASGQNEQALQTDQMIRQLQAGSASMGAGANIANRQMSGAANQQNLWMNRGMNEQQLGTDALNRQLNATLGGGQQLYQLGQGDLDRRYRQLQYTQAGGQGQRDILNEQRNFLLDPYLRQREMAMSFLNPGSVSIVTTPPNRTTQRGSSSGMFK